MNQKHLPEKNCIVCGRVITWRKKWENNWDEIRYCSDKCRKRKCKELDQTIETVIMDLVQISNSICPSEAARKARPDDWRQHMETVRMAARRLVNDNKIEITQKGKPVNPSTAKGPIRLRLVKD